MLHSTENNIQGGWVESKKQNEKEIWKHTKNSGCKSCCKFRTISEISLNEQQITISSMMKFRHPSLTCCLWLDLFPEIWPKSYPYLGNPHLIAVFLSFFFFFPSVFAGRLHLKLVNQIKEPWVIHFIGWYLLNKGVCTVEKNVKDVWKSKEK